MHTLPRQFVRTVLLALFGSAALAGCTTSWTVCGIGECTVELRGEQTVELDLGAFERDVDVEEIRPRSVVVGSGGEWAELTVAQDVTVGDVQVQLLELNGDDVTLRLTKAGA